MKVTAKRLREGNACEDQVDIFEKEWPKGAKTTLKNLRRAVELNLDLGWFVYELLTEEQQEEYRRKLVPVGQEFKAKTIPIDEEHKRKRDLVFEEDNKGLITKKEFNKRLEQLQTEFCEKSNPFWIELMEKKAKILFDVLKTK